MAQDKWSITPSAWRWAKGVRAARGVKKVGLNWKIGVLLFLPLFLLHFYSYLYSSSFLNSSFHSSFCSYAYSSSLKIHFVPPAFKFLLCGLFRLFRFLLYFSARLKARVTAHGTRYVRCELRYVYYWGDMYYFQGLICNTTSGIEREIWWSWELVEVSRWLYANLSSCEIFVGHEMRNSACHMNMQVNEKIRPRLGKFVSLYLYECNLREHSAILLVSS